ncbi:tRNA (adenosine(37)-N6)-threonylcarbamoyltransferase complex transferase subunit TsaD [Nitrospirota bacterium]
MLVLGIDTSCDDTSASLLSFNGEDHSILSNIVSSQNEIHDKYGGIVPELASRRHMEMIWPVVKEALAGREPGELGAIAVCHGPGLIGSLLVGTSFAKSISLSTGVPFIGVNHLEGHILSALLTEPRPSFPLLSMVVSGGHTSLYRVQGYGDYEELGRTRDDAAGEAYDKVSKLLGLGYPGGPAIDRLARTGDRKAIRFPRAMMKDTHDFSFSGLKTAVRLAVEKDTSLKAEDIAAAFQDAVVDVLVKKVRLVIEETGIRSLSLSGGVAANSELRERMAGMCQEIGAEFFPPPINLCTDNGAMIALAGFHRFRMGQTSDLGLNPRAHLPVA